MLNPNEMAEAERINQRLVYRPLSIDGTCTVEPGTRCGKIAERGQGVSVMRAFKRL
jgi:hypothetical protein